MREECCLRCRADKLDHAAKVVAMCVPLVVMALVGLLLQSKKSGRTSCCSCQGYVSYRGQGGSAGIALDRGNGEELQRRRSPMSRCREA
jgi:hypothetical protein